VNKVTKRLFPLPGTPQAILRLGEAKLKSYISTIGLFNAQGKKHPRDLRAAGRAPWRRSAAIARRTRGVAWRGRKTANVILNTAFGEPTIAVDTHIFRVANRTGIAPARDVRAVEDKLKK
jgi:endonuclease-3